MDGLIVKEPYATQLVTGEKTTEFRTTKLPENKTHVKILILNGKYAIGYVQFEGEYFNEVEQTHYWQVEACKMYSPFLKYKHKNGCIIWTNNVEVWE